MPSKNGGLLTLREKNEKEIYELLSLARDLKAEKKRRVFPRRLANRNIALIFLKPSCRTRMSFVVAASDEGAHLEIFPTDDIRFGIKESVKDVARVVGRLFDGVAFRGFGHDMLCEFAEFAEVPVWNGLCDQYHPTQVLADMMTLQEEFGPNLKKLPFTYVGDGRNNQATSLVVAASKLGMDLRLLTPKELQPQQSLLAELKATAHPDYTITISHDPKQVLPGSSAVYSDVWVSMGEEDFVDERVRLLSNFKVTPEFMTLTGRKDAVFLHCLPAFHDLSTDFARRHTGILEVDDEVFEGKASRVFELAENRMHTIKALMVAALA